MIRGARDAIDELSELIEIERDAVNAYDAAIAVCERSVVRARLRGFRGDHETHIRRLVEGVRLLGGKPPVRDHGEHPDEHVPVFSHHSDRSALLAMRGSERLTTFSDRIALDAGMPAQIRAIIERDLAEDEKHLHWITRTLARWERRRAGTQR